MTLPAVASDPCALDDARLAWLIEFIHHEVGIVLTPAKEAMVRARLGKRLRALDLTSFDEYFAYLDTPHGKRREIPSLIDILTTNKTEFFREPKHFELLVREFLPAIQGSHRDQRNRCLRIWSAGCSTGEEPYTLAMVLDDYCRHHGGRFQVHATDVCREALRKAADAVYSSDGIAPVPPPLRERYLLRGTGKWDGYHRIVPELREHVSLAHLNLMDDEFDTRLPYDIIFCRNVTIYFDQRTKRDLARKFHHVLDGGGYLVIGHSETLKGIYEELEFVAPTVYRNPSRPAR